MVNVNDDDSSVLSGAGGINRTILCNTGTLAPQRVRHLGSEQTHTIDVALSGGSRERDLVKELGQE